MSDLNHAPTSNATPNAGDAPDFTPGPWHLSRNGQFVRKSLGATGPGPKDFNVCEVFGVTSPAELRANARLIAAAPEMHAALIECKWLLEMLVKMNRLPADNAALRNTLLALARVSA